MLIEAVNSGSTLSAVPPVQSAVPLSKSKKLAATFTYKYVKKHSETLMFLKKEKLYNTNILLKS